MKTISFRRKAVDTGMRWIFYLCAFLVILPLFLIFFDLLAKGVKELRWSLLTDLPRPVGEAGGGIANGILGTFVVTLLTMIWSVPMAVMCGIYLAEYGRGKFATAVRFAVDSLTGVPSIIMGIFGYILVVLPMKRFSAWAGAAALTMIFVPIVVRTTEDMLRTVPGTVREAALALGIERWKATLYIVVRVASAGIVTGILLAMARIVGETAPLLFTVLGNQFWQMHLDQPMAAMPLQVFSYAISPYADWHDKAWAAALVLITMVLLINIGARVLTREKK
ncbi:MAG: phosphate transporter, permease protein PstA [Deltaproteobacteria bacterium]|nr:phosphate transporter, permease protein PstA [Deltaproteobacteria bacterium]